MSLKEVKILTGVVKRLAKEYDYYLKDADNQRGRIEKLKLREGTDEYDIRKQYEVLDETLLMLPDTKGRWKKAYDQLSELVKEPGIQETSECKAALVMLEEKKPPN